MDMEIDYAAVTGLDYRVFLLYPESSEMSYSLKQYLNSNKRHKIKFCLIIHSAFGVSEEKWTAELDRIIELLKISEYYKVLNKRSLVYSFGLRLNGKFPKNWLIFV